MNIVHNKSFNKYNSFTLASGYGNWVQYDQKSKFYP